MEKITKIIEDFKTLRTLAGEEAEAILNNGQRLSDWLSEKLKEVIQ